MNIERDYLTASERAALAEADDAASVEAEPPVQASTAAAEVHRDAVMALAAATPDPGTVTSVLERVRQEREGLEAAFDEGDSELDYSSYRTRLRELDAQLLHLHGQLAEAATIRRLADEQAAQDWRAEINAIKVEARRAGLDLSNPKLEAEWDRAVRYLGADEQNAEQDAAWFLRTALAMVADRHGKDARRFLHERADTATARAEGDAGDDLSHLKGLDLEFALARLSPAQAQAWLDS